MNNNHAHTRHLDSSVRKLSTQMRPEFFECLLDLQEECLLTAQEQENYDWATD